jgi:E3 ubiquitin-protein ligase UBR1
MNYSTTDLDTTLRRILCDHPRQYDNRYTEQAQTSLLETLFRCLTHDRPDYWRLLFPNGFPKSCRLQDAQEAEEEPEYTEAARGTLCGHIFRGGEVTYHCETCTDDPTAVLCARCFAASDHDGHRLHISLSQGNSGCCDCGDNEAWKKPLHCAIHTATDDFVHTDEHVSAIPGDLQSSIRITVARVLDYLCDVMSCSPEHLRLPKSVESISEDEVRSRLSSEYYTSGDPAESDPEFCLLIWNDEKHTVREVRDQVARACGERMQFGLVKANEANDIGRSVVRHSRDLKQLTKMAKIIEQIKITVTIRSSRDTYREQMCGTMIDWLNDVAGASVVGDQQLFRRIVCEELLGIWRVGSRAPNAQTGRDSLDEHGLEQSRAEHRNVRRRFALSFDPLQIVLQPALVTGDEESDGEDIEIEEIDEQVVDADDVPSLEALAAASRLTAHLVATDPASAELAGDPEATDDADEMDTDGEGEYMDVAEGLTQADADDLAAPVAAVPPPRRDADPQPAADHNVNFMHLPKVHSKAREKQKGPPSYWLMPNAEFDEVNDESLPVYENLRKSIRLDYLLIYDLRLWKTARIGLRDLYISTVVKIPQFKRVLGLRFSGLYTALAQLYLIADREPDHSIVNLSLQILTTPSICQERIDKGNFLTNVMAILYTFLTNREVGYPEEVDPEATLSFDPGAVANRRLFHFFTDLRYFLASDQVQAKIRGDVRYLTQYLDLMKLLQGICPNIRAVGEHVEYETDTWISASVLTRESNKLCRVFAETYKSQRDETESLNKAISMAAGFAMMNSMGLERRRFEQSEIKQVVRFDHTSHGIVKFSVAQGSLSFHHPLHYTLSWLLEIGKESKASIDTLKTSAVDVVQRIQEAPLGPQDISLKTSVTSGEDALLAMFDYPLRVCAWLAQMRANMWVRNGMSLRHQMGQYKSVPYRDVAHQRDLFLLQTALVTCSPTRVLASMVDRFGLSDWMNGKYATTADCDDTQMVDLAEDLVYLLINLLSDRDTLTSNAANPDSSLSIVRKEIAHSLCFKPLSYSDLIGRLTERVQDHAKLQEVLDTMTKFKPPEGLHDTGLFELKEEFLQELDPYNSHFTKNQRDEAENIYKKWLGKKLKKDPEDVVLEPKLHSITSEGYRDLAAVCGRSLFADIIFRCLIFVADGYKSKTNILATRTESFLLVVLQLALIATLEDKSPDDKQSEESSFIYYASNVRFPLEGGGFASVVTVLHKIWTMDDYSACRTKIRHILRLFHQKRPAIFSQATRDLDFPAGRFDTASPANLEIELEAKKKQARDSKAKIMAQFQQQQQSFMDSQGGFDWDDDDLESPDAELPASTEKRTWKFPSGLCIQCREETSDAKLYGTFAMITDGHILRETPLEDADVVGEVLATPKSLDRARDRQQPFGLSGANHGIVTQMDSQGKEVKVERQGISRGWPTGSTTKGPLTSSCGHIMHFTCFENYYQSVLRRHAQQVARQHPERVSAQEFVCPLCKALANAFLPIVWKSTLVSYPGALETRSSYADFVDSELENLARYSDTESEGFAKSAASVHKQNLSTFANAALGLAIERSAMTEMGSPSWSTLAERPELAPISELASVYLRLKGPLNIIARVTQPGTFPARFHGKEEPNSFHLLLNSLANSVTATEIAYRGRESEFGTTLLTGIPQQTLSHLLILASTIKSYAATCHILVRGAIDEHFRQVYLSIFRKLFGQTTLPDDSTDLETIFLDNFNTPLLRVDSFTFFVHASLITGPLLSIDQRHMLRLCLTAELIRVVVAYTHDHDGFLASAQAVSEEVLADRNEAEMHTYKQFLLWVEDQCGKGPTEMANIAHFTAFKESIDLKGLATLACIVERYALAFLRKAAIFLHVAWGVDFPVTTGTEASLPELPRLLHLMQLPDIDEILQDFAEYAPSIKAKSLASQWILDLLNFRDREIRQPLSPISRYAFDVRGKAIGVPHETVFGIRLQHPAPLELIGLPKYYDVLLELSTRRKCPTTGKELQDPALCLFCGAMFCSQTVCCQSPDGRGGCNAHVERCSAPIGMFLLIRKCNVVLLHVMRDPNAETSARAQGMVLGGSFLVRSADTPPLGSFFPAPYLTKHGETDGGLRNKHQLMLSQMRYDRLLRDTWLMVNGNVWSAIARKLEGEVNSGGWETL